LTEALTGRFQTRRRCVPIICRLCWSYLTIFVRTRS